MVRFSWRLLPGKWAERKGSEGSCEGEWTSEGTCPRFLTAAPADEAESGVLAHIPNPSMFEGTQQRRIFPSC